MIQLSSILAPTDFSELSLANLDIVSSLAKQYSAKVYLLYVVDNRSFLAFPSVGANSESILRELERKASDQLKTLVAEKLAHLGSVQQVIRRGDPYREIVRFARESGSDLVVIATHGRAGLSHVLMGSVAEKVVRYSSVPVLTVKPVGIRGALMDQADLDEQLHLKPSAEMPQV